MMIIFFMVALGYLVTVLTWYALNRGTLGYRRGYDEGHAAGWMDATDMYDTVATDLESL